VEILIALTLVSIAGSLCIASLSPETQRTQEDAAARFLAMQVRDARQEALQRSTTVGIRFEQSGERMQFRVYADGNRNGVRTRDIQDGIDMPLAAARSLDDDFRGVTFGIAQRLPPIETGGEPVDVDGDPIRIGPSHILSFGPTGRGSSGTLYLRGRGGGQFAVRIFGPTGRVRLLQFRASDAQWIER
jgi:type II secretory pathway pseudopilin PulG